MSSQWKKIFSKIDLRQAFNLIRIKKKKKKKKKKQKKKYIKKLKKKKKKKKRLKFFRTW